MEAGVRGEQSWEAMIGQLIIVFVVVVFLPMMLMLSGSVVAVLLGWLLKDNGEKTHEGSELIDLNR